VAQRPAHGAAVVAGAEVAGPPSPPAAASSAPAGWLQIDARPWGELVRVRDATGQELPLPADRTTPLALPLPAGEYTAWVRDPATDRERSCRAALAPGGAALCTVALRRLRAEELLGATP
jgi:hypothetical protein